MNTNKGTSSILEKILSFPDGSLVTSLSAFFAIRLWLELFVGRVDEPMLFQDFLTD